MGHLLSFEHSHDHDILVGIRCPCLNGCAPSPDWNWNAPLYNSDLTCDLASQYHNHFFGSRFAAVEEPHYHSFVDIRANHLRRVSKMAFFAHRTMKISLDPPPRGIFTYEDTVSGKLVFESTKDENIGFIYMYFRGTVHTAVVNPSTKTHDGVHPSDPKNTGKEVLFSYENKLYQGNEKLLKHTQLEWPFSFNFRTVVNDPKNLPSSGTYGSSRIQYTIAAVAGQIGHDEEHLRRMINPEDTTGSQQIPGKAKDAFLWTAKHLGEGASQEIEFVQIRPEDFVGLNLAGPFGVNLEVPKHHLPNIRYDPDRPEKHGLFRTQPGIPFSVNLELPQKIIEGIPFPLYLSVTSPIPDWTTNPPPVHLTSLKIHLRVVTIALAKTAQVPETPREESVFHSKNLSVNIGPQPLDVGQLYNFKLSGKGVVPSFSTQVLERVYNLPTEVGIEVGGKTFKVDFIEYYPINIVSRLAATGGIPQGIPFTRGNAPVEYNPLNVVSGLVAMGGVRQGVLAGGRKDQTGNHPMNVVSGVASTGQLPQSVQPDGGKASMEPQPTKAVSGLPERFPVDGGNVPMEDPLSYAFTQSWIQSLQTTTIILRYNHMGRLIQQGNGPLQHDSVMEAALTLSRHLTTSGIQHEFPGGSVVRLLAWKPPRGSNLKDWKSNTMQSDREFLQPFFHWYFKYIPAAWAEDKEGIRVRYHDVLHGEDIKIEFPPLAKDVIEEEDEHWQKHWIKETAHWTDQVKIDPVSLFNYRLSCAINRDLQPEELDDFQSLYTSFEHELHHHKKHIHVNVAKITAGRYPVIQRVLSRVGIELGIVPGSTPEEAGPSGTWNKDYSEHHSNPGSAQAETHPDETPVKGIKKLGLFHKHHEK